ncbi:MULTISPECIES: hypothetical protein [unclassified Bradyrhizobium]|uniref:hypothetical protein n=1 Tax=unclassified Bradyrhizobium TaxID=2631580 RepID=UPI0029163901|nr:MULTISPECIES: hypothetical protein [unclassified Bradyrhizobium]
MTRDIPENLTRLHSAEQLLRQKACSMIAADPRLQLHLSVTEAAMDLADSLRTFSTNDEDLKVAQILGMRTFNAFGASIKLTLSGYHQNSALILRDVMETVFLLDLFAGDRPLIERWRFADKKARMKDFSPVKVREALDARDGFTSKKRFEMYELFSELAGHPNMKSAWMMRRQKDGDADRPVHGSNGAGSRRLRNGAARSAGWRETRPIFPCKLGSRSAVTARLCPT